MLNPLRTVYDQTHLTTLGWVKASIPLSEFMNERAYKLNFYRDGKIKLKARFSRWHEYPLWREWIPCLDLPIKYHTITIFSDKQFAYNKNGCSFLRKAMEVTLLDSEVEDLINVDYNEVPRGLTVRLLGNLIL